MDNETKETLRHLYDTILKIFMVDYENLNPLLYNSPNEYRSDIMYNIIRLSYKLIYNNNLSNSSFKQILKALPPTD